MNTNPTTEEINQSDMAGARKKALLLIMAPVLVTLIWAFSARLTSEPVREENLPPVAAGEAAPRFTFPLLTGGTSSLSDYRGKLVLVNVWATWCPPCIDEMPDLQNLYVLMKRDGVPFEILGVSIDALGADPVRKWVDRFGLTFPILLDTRGRIKKLYRTTGVPETFIVEPNGKLVQKIIGPRKWDNPLMVSYLKRIYRESEEKKAVPRS